MCITNNLQKHIRNLTGDGEVVARFLVDTVQGKPPGVKACHQMEALKYLDRYGFSDDANQEEPHFWGLIPTPEELAEKNRSNELQPVRPEPVEGRVRRTQNSQLNTHNSPVTHLDILNYDIAHLIRRETSDGHTIVQFLAHVMTGPDKPFTPKKLRIRHTDRMAAAREVLRRGFGHFGRKRKLVHDYDDEADTYDTLHTDLAKRMREYTEHGTDAVRFLLDVMTNADPDDPYTWHHRVSAAQELIRRGWDTNYDAITPEMLETYWHNQPSTRLSTGQKKHLAGLATTPDDYNTYDTTDYEALAADLRESESNNSLPPRWGKARMGVRSTTQDQPKTPTATPTRRSCEGRNPKGQGTGTANSNPFVLSLSKDGSSSKPEPTTKPPLPQGEGWGEGESLVHNPSPNQSEVPHRHSLKASPRPRSGSGTPAPQNEQENSSQSSPSMSVLPDPDLDCYYEPLNPNDQAIFDYELRLESGDLPDSVRPESRPEPVEGPVEGLVEPTPAAWRDYELALAQIREAAASEGIPLLPNPLAGTLMMPTIRSP